MSEQELLAELASGDEARAEAAAVRLAAAGEAVLPALEPLLASGTPDHRWWAVRTLGQMTSPRMDWLLSALGDPSAEVRAAAALALAAHPAEDVAPLLVQALDDDDSIVAILAVNAVASIGKAATPALLEAFPKASPRARIHIMRTISELEDHRAIPLMMKAIEEESAMLRYWAEQGIERLGLNMVYIKPE
ncbi:MAG TPA: HEAT repeat domain-containing protein [Anaerolineales bacterium]|nr:HEAT repeat domain-containing protein [Anaerolineales bacterium]